MQINIDVRPVVGESVHIISKPFLHRDGETPFVVDIIGIVEDSRNNGTEFKVLDIDDYFPLHRIVQFTFGGVSIDNEYYDILRCKIEDALEIELIKKQLSSN